MKRKFCEYLGMLFMGRKAPVMGDMPPLYVYTDSLSGLHVTEDWRCIPDGCRVWEYRPVAEPKVTVVKRELQ